MLARTPLDVFLHYSLGMEYLAAKEPAKAADAFRRCIELDTDYLPAHIEAGKALRAAGDLPGARATFQAAMELAERLGDHHARDHIRQQIEGLG